MSLKKRLAYIIIVGIIDLIFPEKGWGIQTKSPRINHMVQTTVTRPANNE